VRRWLTELVLACGVALLALLFIAYWAVAAIDNRGITETALAGGRTQQSTPAGIPAVQAEPSNYCLGCHIAGDSQLENATAWRGDIGRSGVTACPAAKRIQEEQYFTERLMLAIERGRASLPGWVNTSSIDARYAAAQQTYSRALDVPVESLDGYTAEMATLRYRLGKIYNQVNQAHDTAKRSIVILTSFLVSLVLFGSFAWGLYHTRHVPISQPGTWKRRGVITAVIFLAAVLAFFALPLLRPAAEVVTASTPVQQAVQTVLDTAGRAASAADRAQARAWMFGRIGAVWYALDEDRGLATLDMARQAAKVATSEADALWGEAAASQEAAVGDLAKLEKAGLVANQLDSVRGRAWGLGQAGAEWIQIEPIWPNPQAEGTLGEAWQSTQEGRGVYQDLDRRLIAVRLAALNPAEPGPALDAVAKVQDPELRAWGLREIAVITGEARAYTLAAEAARQVADPIQRARSLSKIAAHSGEAALFQEARDILLEASQEGQTASLAYALSDLAVEARDEALVEKIDTAYPAARAAAYLRLERFLAAWEAVQNITDPYEQARALAAIADAWSLWDVEQASTAARQVGVFILQQRALRDVIRNTGQDRLLDELTDPYYRLQALTALKRYHEAAELAGKLKDTYPLLELVDAWAGQDPQAALKLVDQMQLEADKAIALRNLAVLEARSSPSSDELFQRALGMALAARLRDDALAPAQASLALAQAFMSIDPVKAVTALQQAYEITERISIK
jgi:hypothetical protein